MPEPPETPWRQMIYARLTGLEERTAALERGRPQPPKPFPDRLAAEPSPGMFTCEECGHLYSLAEQGTQEYICRHCDHSVWTAQTIYGASPKECAEAADDQPRPDIDPGISAEVARACALLIPLLYAWAVHAMRKGDPARTLFYGRLWCGLLAVRDDHEIGPTHDTLAQAELRGAVLTGKLPDIWMHMFG